MDELFGTPSEEERITDWRLRKRDALYEDLGLLKGDGMRTITVVLKVAESKAAEAIWDSHKDDKLLNGCHVVSISNGDVCERLETAESLLTPKKHEQYLKSLDDEEKMCEKLGGMSKDQLMELAKKQLKATAKN